MKMEGRKENEGVHSLESIPTHLKQKIKKKNLQKECSLELYTATSLQQAVSGPHDTL